MTTTQEIQPGRRIDLTRKVVGFDRADGRARLVDQVAGRPPQRIDGFTIGTPQIAGDPPHDGETHPDGDGVLYLVSGAVTVSLELCGGNTLVDLGAGDAVVVPQGERGTRSRFGSQASSSTSRLDRIATPAPFGPRGNHDRRPRLNRPGPARARASRGGRRHPMGRLSADFKTFEGSSSPNVP